MAKDTLKKDLARDDRYMLVRALNDYDDQHNVQTDGAIYYGLEPLTDAEAHGRLGRLIGFSTRGNQKNVLEFKRIGRLLADEGKIETGGNPLMIEMDIEIDEDLVRGFSVDLLAHCILEFRRLVKLRADETMRSAINYKSPRCVKAGSVVHKQPGGRVYNKKCDLCGIPLIAKRQSREPDTGKRWILYSHPNAPLARR